MSKYDVTQLGKMLAPDGGRVGVDVRSEPSSDDLDRIAKRNEGYDDVRWLYNLLSGDALFETDEGERRLRDALLSAFPKGRVPQGARDALDSIAPPGDHPARILIVGRHMWEAEALDSQSTAFYSIRRHVIYVNAHRFRKQSDMLRAEGPEAQRAFFLHLVMHELAHAISGAFIGRKSITHTTPLTVTTGGDGSASSIPMALASRRSVDVVHTGVLCREGPRNFWYSFNEAIIDGIARHAVRTLVGSEKSGVLYGKHELFGEYRQFAELMSALHDYMRRCGTVGRNDFTGMLRVAALHGVRIEKGGHQNASHPFDDVISVPLSVVDDSGRLRKREPIPLSIGSALLNMDGTTTRTDPNDIAKALRVAARQRQSRS